MPTAVNLKRLAFTILLTFKLSFLFSQGQLTQTVRGIILDADIKLPLIGATIIVEGLDPFIGTTADLDGNFRLESVPVGRHNFKVSYIGYEPLTVSEILVTSGKEVVLNIELKESSFSLDEVVVRASSSKERPQNSMATISARTFSVEETSRYAGGFDDPARLASAFAGVTTTQTTSNAIIIRGNSPKGVLWRFEGVDIPAAFHFPNVDFVGGGGITVLSNQMLRNSDFYTGAFPAEYGNATAGVFDIKMRTGNSQKREYAAQLSLLGTDISAEGPFKQGGKSTYLFNYRYSTLGLLDQLFSMPNVPIYQDLSFKFDFPTQKAGTFSLWGLGAIDYNLKEEETDPALWESDYSRTRLEYNNRFGAVGLSHRIIIGPQTYLHSTISADAMSYSMDKHELTFAMELFPSDYIESTEGKYAFRSTLNHKFNQRVSSRTGIVVNSLFFNNLLEKAMAETPDELRTFVDHSGTGLMTQAFSQFRIELLPNLSTNVGFHTMYLDINNEATFEPRLGLSWNVTQNDEISAAYGLHSQMEELRTYFSQSNVNGAIETPNKGLGFIKSHHFVLGYNRKLSDVLRLKIEPYYQVLEDVPVYPDSHFSIINITSNWAINQKLENLGTAENFGIDLTVERFLKDGYYFLFTSSVFNSRYVGGDGKQYSTKFNRGYVVNALAGKEFLIKDNNLLSISVKATYMGGLRYTPALHDESIAAQRYIGDYSQVFAGQFPSSTILDFTVNYRINRKNYSGVWSLMVKNALLQPDYSDPFYDFISNKVKIDKMTTPVPSIGYKIEF